MREASPLIAYLVALGCATYLTAHGVLHDATVVATLLGLAVPTYWQHGNKHTRKE